MKKRIAILLVILTGIGFAFRLWGVKLDSPQPTQISAVLPPQHIPALIRTHSPVSSPKIQQQTEAELKLHILEEIFQSKNDNDPRLDRDFLQLTQAAKTLLEKKYNQLRQEDRNERGTIVFLIGRNLNSQEDWNFLEKVLAEPPCLSLSNCSQSSTAESSHEDAQVAITLEYPRIVAIKSVENYLKNNPNSPEAIEFLKHASKSKNPVIQEMASNFLNSTVF